MATLHAKAADPSAGRPGGGGALPWRPGLNGLLAAAAVAAALVWAYEPSFRFLVEQWNRDPNYSYGFFVIPIAAMIFWNRRELLARSAGDPVWWPLLFVPLAAVLAVRYPLYEWNEQFVETATIPFVVGALVLAVGGWSLMRVAYPAVIFLFFMLPLPSSLNQWLAQPLQRLATLGSVNLLQLFGLPVMSEGNVIIIGATPLEVARACNGLSMLLSFVTLIAATVILVQRPAWERVVLMLSAVPIALVSNILRITATAICYHRMGQVAGDKVAHDLAGWMMMPLALALVWLELRLMAWLFHEVEDVDARALLLQGRGGRGDRGGAAPGGPLKIAFLSPAGVIGGAEMCLLDLLASYRADRPDWALTVFLGDDGPLRAAVAALGVPCELLPMPGRLAALGDASLSLGGRRGGRLALAARGPGAALAASSYLRTLRRKLRAERPDLVQTNGMKAHVLGAWAAPRGVPVVWHLHDFLGSRAVMARLLRWSSRRGVRGVAVSKAVAADARRVLGPRVPVETVYNAADLARFAPGTGDGPWLDAEAGMATAPAGTVRVGLVATFARWKGHEVFLDAVARLPADLPARFYIVGGPLYRSAGSQHSAEGLRAKAEAAGLTGRVGFAGHQGEPADVFRALDVVVHASTRPEPFGRVIVEAMACGRAVVASRTGGASELFEDGVSALGCPPGDPAALAAALARLVTDPGLRAALGAAGRREAAARFDRARLAGEWAGVYAAAVGNTERDGPNA